ncbi:D-alanyl-D-alanine carboxypeptidase, partial [Bacillus cereus]|nr:D-alanyl-D-alanine carboxypeptidase [Bacillus cereus]
KAPIKKGESIGTLVIKKDKDVLLKQTILAKEDVAEASWWELFKRSFGMFSTSK